MDIRMPRPRARVSLARLLACVALLAAISIAGAASTSPAIPGWYDQLVKPAWTPPNLAFPLVWTTLYALMALALWRLWDRAQRSATRRRALQLMIAQLVLNAAWSPVFFALHWVGLALAIVLALIVLVALLLKAAFRADRLAGWMLVPYLPWLCYAASLNGAILVLN